MDIADRAEEDRVAYEQAAKKAAPYQLPDGTAGECSGCGEESPRLVGGLCAPCRDARLRQYPAAVRLRG